MSEWDKAKTELESISIDISHPASYVPEFIKKWERVKAVGDKNQQKLEAIRDALNTPNTGDEWFVQEVIKILNLRMTKNGWEVLG